MFQAQQGKQNIAHCLEAPCELAYSQIFPYSTSQSKSYGPSQQSREVNSAHS